MKILGFNFVELPYLPNQPIRVPNHKGVYIVYITENKGGRTILYIGRTSQICNRLQNHTNLFNKIKNDFGSLDNVNIVLYKNDSWFERRTVERLLINKFIPKYNIAIPSMPEKTQSEVLLERCQKSPYFFATNFLTINKKPFSTKLSEKQFNEQFFSFLNDKK